MQKGGAVEPGKKIYLESDKKEKGRKG